LSAKSVFAICREDDQTLPHEMSGFAATNQEGAGIRLTWNTQVESDVMGFRIYRGGDTDIESAILISALIPATNTSQPQQYEYVDWSVEAPAVYHYWLEVLDYSGDAVLYGPVAVSYSNDDTDSLLWHIREGFTIYPNPFNHYTAIAYDLDCEASVRLIIYNQRGQMIRIFDEGNRSRGRHQLNWDGKDDKGRNCGTGVYTILLRVGDQHVAKRVTLLK
ncbi:MAG: FlgD immunoglobulin-like domain containing protein, partial [Candidatus Cloacimonadaceae bacterium]|nr:FlgD immunoglobulin-like domain containing protein [Candidatus Cloacimonadaceae bacterium]